MEFLLFCHLVSITFYLISALNLGDNCIGPNKNPGTCVERKSCKKIDSLFDGRLLTQESLTFIKKSICGNIGEKSLVCCESDLKYNVVSTTRLGQCDGRMTKFGVCGGQILSDRIVGGEETFLGQYPWMANLIYDLGVSEGEDVKCGGSLITDQHVITAAHCIASIPRKWKLVTVRLGEHKLKSKIDCDEDHCADPYQDFGIEKVIVHEAFRKGYTYEDIAIIKLDNKVKFNEYVKPVCLPICKTRNYNSTKLWTAGWGRTENAIKSDVKLRVQLNRLGLDKCNEMFSKLRSRLVIKEGQICAVGTTGKDSCKGDSGGPLMMEGNPEIYLVGVVSFGALECGREDIPSVYTNIANYVDWIQKNIAT